MSRNMTEASTHGPEISSIREELSHLDSITNDIAWKRAALLQRLDSLQSRTRALPPEILSLIFQYYVAAATCINRELVLSPFGHQSGYRQRNGPFPPMFLGSISHRWREIAWSTPQLWTSLSFYASSANADSLAAMLGLYLTNLSGATLALGITFEDRYSSLSWETDPIALILFQRENRRKIQALLLTLIPLYWLDRMNHLPKLRWVQLSGCMMEHPVLLSETFLAHSPALYLLRLDGFVAPASTWSSVTDLRLENIRVADALQHLINMPHIVRFSYTIGGLYAPGRLRGDEDLEAEMLLATFPDTLSLPLLEHLHWPFKENASSTLFLNRVRLPRLRRLIWDQRDRPLVSDWSGAIWTFFKNLSTASLTSIHLYALPSDLESSLLELIYQGNPRIEEITLDSCSETAVLTILASLTPNLDLENTMGVVGGYYLPELKEVAVDEFTGNDQALYTWEHLPEYFGDIIADMVDIRMQANPGSTFIIKLDFGITVDMTWSEDAKAKFSALQRTGREVTVLKDGEKVDWLKMNCIE
ncbi:hypothetical protein D9756_002748 [Leucocoprinus leucothites]|uniref:F-box domain-containing protein n=1 Tax=Leucocoprinus leucothites TaxID=201217 RepID=A0A8H5GBR4_9AGAR|nr:hypothetical protein D9756_002748 [Leucoagaricus leucothites]